MSSIQDRIRRLESGGSPSEESLPATGTVAAAKARLSRSSVDDAASARKVSNIANRFAAPKDEQNAPKSSSVSQIREKLTTQSQTNSDSVSKRAAAIAEKASSSGTSSVSARAAAIGEKTTSATTSGSSVTARAAALADKDGVSKGGNQVSARRDALQARAGESGGVAARAGKFERATSADTGVTGLVSMRTGQLVDERTKSDVNASGSVSSPSTPLASRAAVFENAKAVASENESTKKTPSRVAAAQVAFSGAKADKDEQPKVGKVASAAKDRDLHEVRTELADMVDVAKQLLSELASLRAGMREMEKTRDALLKRVETLERKAK